MTVWMLNSSDSLFLMCDSEQVLDTKEHSA